LTNPSLSPMYGPLENLPQRQFTSARLKFEAAGTATSDVMYAFDTDIGLTKYQCISDRMSHDQHGQLIKWLDDSWAGRSQIAPVFCWLLKPGHHLIETLKEKGFLGDCMGYVQLSVVDSTTVQLGAVIAKNAQGIGIATEACCALIELAQGYKGVQAIQGVCHPKNERSVALLSRLGFEKEGQTDVSSFPNYNGSEIGPVHQSPIDIWRLRRRQDGTWPLSPSFTPTSQDLNTTFTNPQTS